MVYHNLKRIYAISPHWLSVHQVSMRSMKTVGIIQKQGTSQVWKIFKKSSKNYQNLEYHKLKSQNNMHSWSNCPGDRMKNVGELIRKQSADEKIFKKSIKIWCTVTSKQYGPYHLMA